MKSPTIAFPVAATLLLAACGGEVSPSGTSAAQQGGAGSKPDAALDTASGPEGGHGGVAGSGGANDGGAGAGGANDGGAGAGDTGADAGGSGTSGALQYDCEKHSSATAEAACQLLAEATCKLLSSCMTTVISYSSETQCAERMKLGLLTLLAAPGSGATPALFAAAAEVTAALSCEQYYEAMAYEPVIKGDPTACGGAGTLADGKSCFWDGQCASARCIRDHKMLCGTCGGGIGASCEGSFDCARRNYCSSLKHCEAAKAAGAACAFNSECKDGLYCEQHVCAPRKDVGGACASDADCRPTLVCGQDETCKERALGAEGAGCNAEPFSCNSYLMLVCQAGVCTKVVPLNVGDQCGPMSLCASGSWCVIPSGEQKGTCALFSEDGAPCEVGKCFAPARCSNDVCTVPTGETCPP